MSEAQPPPLFTRWSELQSPASRKGTPAASTALCARARAAACQWIGEGCGSWRDVALPGACSAHHCAQPRVERRRAESMRFWCGGRTRAHLSVWSVGHESHRRAYHDREPCAWLCTKCCCCYCKMSRHLEDDRDIFSVGGGWSVRRPDASPQGSPHPLKHTLTSVKKREVVLFPAE